MIRTFLDSPPLERVLSSGLAKIGADRIEDVSQDDGKQRIA